MGETEFGNLWAATSTTYSSTALSKKRNQRLQGMSEVLPTSEYNVDGAATGRGKALECCCSPVESSRLCYFYSQACCVDRRVLACLALLASPSAATWEPVGLLVEGPQRLCPRTTTTAIPTCIIILISDNHHRRRVTFTHPLRTKKKETNTNPGLHPANDVSLFLEGHLSFELDPVQ